MATMSYQVNEDPIEVIVYLNDVVTMVQPHHPEAENNEPWASIESAQEWAEEYVAQEQAIIDAGPVHSEIEPIESSDEVVEETPAEE